MIRINLQVETSARAPATGAELAVRTSGQLLRSPLVLIAALVLAGTLWFVARQQGQLEGRQTALEVRIQREVAESTTVAREQARADSLRRVRQDVEERLDAVRDVDGNRYAFVRLMDQLAATLPADAWIESIETTAVDEATGNLTVRVQGYAPNDDAVSTLLTQLDDSPFIADASFIGSSRVPLNRQNVVKFELGMRTEIPDPSFFVTQSPNPELPGTSVIPGMPGADPTVPGGTGLPALPALPPGAVAPPPPPPTTSTPR